eukprot:COSAG02_NODE_3558_length_6563_cov_38.861850_5_plen_130_part_00
MFAAIRNASKKDGLRKVDRKQKETAQDTRGSLLEEITSGCGCTRPYKDNRDCAGQLVNLAVAMYGQGLVENMCSRRVARQLLKSRAERTESGGPKESHRRPDPKAAPSLHESLQNVRPQLLQTLLANSV